MTLIRSVNQQWHKAELANTLCQRLASEAAIAPLLVGATSLATVCHMVTALAVTDEYDVVGAAVDDTLLVALFFDAFRLLFVKATQQQLSQCEQLCMSIARRLADIVAITELAVAQQQQLALMPPLVNQLDTLAQQRRQSQRNMC